jgi:hypothetical protein
MQQPDIYRRLFGQQHYGVSKHMAGAIMHEPVPYSTPPIQVTEAKREMLAAAA